MDAALSLLEYREPGTPRPLGPISSRWIAPLPYWLACGIILAPVVIVSELGGGAFNPSSYYLFPVVELYFATPVIAIWLGLRCGLRWRVATKHGIESLRPEYPRALLGLGLVLVYFFMGPLTLKLGMAARWPAIESLRTLVEAGTAPKGAIDVRPFRFTGTEVFGNGVVILYTEGSAGHFPASGSGLLYVPDGGPIPGYNRGSDGQLIGNWYWFVTD